MAITVKHKFVSAIPDAGDPTIVQPSNWNDDHDLVGTIPVANGGTGAATLTGYVKGNGTSAMTAATTIPNTDITGLGTASTKDAGAANGVATLDAGGKVPVSELPAAVLGALSYQGTWNASTNSPTLTSSVGTKGYYYVVSVAGNTDLNGITDWLVGDWAVFNGSVWQKVDNTETVTSVNGQVGAVVLTYSDVGAFPATSTTGTGNVVLATNPTISSPNIDVIDFDQTYATALTAGQLGWDGNNTLALGMAGGNVVQHLGEDTFFYIKASSAITKGQLCMFTGAVGASGVLTAAPSTGVTNPEYIMGIAAENIALNGFGLVQNFGELTGVNTNGFNEGDVLYYDSAVTGGLTNVYPTSGIIATIAAVAKKSAGGGVLSIRVTVTQRLTASTGISVSQNGTGATITNSAPDQTVSITGGGTTTVTGTYPNFTVSSADQYTGTVTSVAATAGTGISVSGSPITSSGTLTITNTAPDQTVAIASGTGISVTGTYPNFTVTNTSPSSGGTVTSVSGTSGRITSTGGTTPVIDLASGVAIAGTTGSSTLIPVVTIDTYGRVTGITTASNPQGTVTSVTGTAPVVSSGGATPAISMAAATGSVNGYLTSTDWTTFNGKAPAVTYTTNYVPFGQGTTTPNLSASFTYVTGTGSLTAPQVVASNGIVVNNRTIGTTFSIPSGYSATSAGPITISSGVSVTVPTGGKWVVL